MVFGKFLFFALMYSWLQYHSQFLQDFSRTGTIGDIKCANFLRKQGHNVMESSNEVFFVSIVTGQYILVAIVTKWYPDEWHMYDWSLVTYNCYVIEKSWLASDSLWNKKDWVWDKGYDLNVGFKLEGKVWLAQGRLMILFCCWDGRKELLYLDYSYS